MNTLPSPQQLREEWAAALESGEFIQGRRMLCQITADGDRYCCLGVMCEVYKRHATLPTAKRYTYVEYDGHMSVPARKVEEAFGVDVTTEGVMMTMNDIDDKTFVEIAAYIRTMK